MRGVKRCQESTGRMKKHRYSSEFKVTAVKLATASMESLFHTTKTEWIRGWTFATFAELEAALTAYIRFYNRRRLAGSGNCAAACCTNSLVSQLHTA